MTLPGLTEMASKLAELPLAGLQRQYPNKLDHVLFASQDVRQPAQLHPAFFGCFDWHSSVHGHWALIRLLKCCPDAVPSTRIRRVLEENLSTANLQEEAAYFAHPGRPSFERPYGWAWLLKLAEELHTWDDALGVRLSKNMKPLTQVVIDRYFDFFPKQNYPIRSGVHSDTAFGLTFALDYARSSRSRALESLVLERAEFYFATDKDYPARWEPGGDHFLSPALTVAELMRRTMESTRFATWLSTFLPHLDQGEPSQLLKPVRVSFREDPKIVHLDGLNLSRAWALRALAGALPLQDGRREILSQAADEHATSALEHVFSGNYDGEHWLATFAVYFLTQEHG